MNSNSKHYRFSFVQRLNFFIAALVVFHFSVLVTHAQLSQRSITESFTEPYESSEVAAGEQGLVTKVLVIEGQHVKTGEVLAELDKTELIEAKRLAQARAESTARVDTAKAILKLQQTQKENFEELAKKGHSNPFEMRKVLAEYETAVADLNFAIDESEQNKIELDRMIARLKQRDVVSPMHGIVTEIHRRPGEFIAANAPVFATVVRVDRLKVRFYLNATDLDRLQVGTQVDVLVGISQTPKKASVSYVSPVIDPNSGTGRVDVVIDNSDFAFRSGIICVWVGVSSNVNTLQLN